jgi:hypothetical protein
LRTAMVGPLDGAPSARRFGRVCSPLAIVAQSAAKTKARSNLYGSMLAEYWGYKT